MKHFKNNCNQNECSENASKIMHGFLLPKLFWRTVRKKAEGREFGNILRSLKTNYFKK